MANNCNSFSPKGFLDRQETVTGQYFSFHVFLLQNHLANWHLADWCLADWRLADWRLADRHLADWHLADWRWFGRCSCASVIFDSVHMCRPNVSRPIGVWPKVAGPYFFFKIKSFNFWNMILRPGNPYWRGRLNTVDLLPQTSLDQLLFILNLFLGQGRLTER